MAQVYAGGQRSLIGIAKLIWLSEFSAEFMVQNQACFFLLSLTE